METEGKVKLPVGIENFEKIRTEKFYYIDKTNFIKELLGNWGEVNLFTRPRRFGKSLNMSMLKSFFEIGMSESLFEGLEISKETELCDQYMGKFPVISVSLKGVVGEDSETAKEMLCKIISEEAYRLNCRLDSNKLDETQKKSLGVLLNATMSDADLMTSIRVLSGILKVYYGKKTIILIDEYDVPLAKAQQKGYYDKMITLIRTMFEQALKTNDSLYFAVLTGCLRVSKESIFTGLNNPKIFSITSVRCDEYFGFVDGEVREILAYYNRMDSYDLIKEWYNGYRFGDADVYCPWDVISYIDELCEKPTVAPKAYWSNSSGNEVVDKFIEISKTPTLKRDIEELVAGEVVNKEIDQDITYKGLYNTIDNIWSVMFATGYLTQRGEPDGDVFHLAIPNKEIRKIFTRKINEWFRADIASDGVGLAAFCEALKMGDAEAVEKKFNNYLRKTISIRDTAVKKEKKENFYHGILLGILGYKEDWGIKSNRESGDDYSDIMIEIDEEDIGIIIEVKYPDGASLISGCRQALKQIDTRGYDTQLLENGMQKILKYGIACNGKRCKVALDAEALI